jgi:hypothetical protein
VKNIHLRVFLFFGINVGALASTLALAEQHSLSKLRPCLVRKNFQDSPSHRIFDHMHAALNKDKNKN